MSSINDNLPGYGGDIENKWVYWGPPNYGGHI